MRSVVVVLVGDELLSGLRRDGNGAWLLARLAEAGTTATAMHCVGDDELAIADLVREVARRADLVVLSGGLGPTEDDRTRAALAQAADVPLVHDDDAWQAVVDCLARRERVPTDSERRQGLVPEGGRWLPNPVGVAPGLDVRITGARVVALPGVPREWRAMCEAFVLPGLDDQDEAAHGVVWVAGVPEGEVALRIAGLAALERVELASYPHDGEVELRVRARGIEAEEVVEEACAALHEALGVDAFDPPPGGAIEHAVVAMLAARGMRLATAESVTGGLIARMLTRVPGASAAFPVGWVTYATAQKIEQLGVAPSLIATHGVVSDAVVRAMAEGARARSAADAALATTGTAGPDGLVEPGRAAVPPGRVHVALALAGRETTSVEMHVPHPRDLVQRFAAVKALDLLRRALAAQDGAEGPARR